MLLKSDLLVRGRTDVTAVSDSALQDVDGKHFRQMARPERFELPTYCSGGNRSIQLSYGRAGWDVIRVTLSETFGKPAHYGVVSPDTTCTRSVAAAGFAGNLLEDFADSRTRS